LILQEVTVLGEFARYAGIEAIEIQPAGGDRKPLRVYYFDNPGERGYYDGEGRSPYDGGWRKPIKDAPMTSPYNLKRKHPILKKVMPHLGIDFGAPTGTPVGAASSGTVTFASFRGPTGNLVKIAHAGNIETGYAHLSRFAEGLKVGDRVKRLQVIGYVGSTGRSTGPHLHFSATRNREFIDPATLNMDAMRTLSKTSRETFLLVKAKYDAALDAIALPQALPPQPSEPAEAVTATTGAAPTKAADEELQVAEDEGEQEMDGGSPTAAVPVAPPAAAQPGSKAAGSAVYLTDKELLELQGASDEGEVME
ncbi:MAG TPA: M23 family metallopeptidase, partial [Polyangiaceae bacterium]|nr:M23 family metallopeptidase [Polyangiaceae bacterium]